jgi:hypothetical protein
VRKCNGFSVRLACAFVKALAHEGPIRGDDDRPDHGIGTRIAPPFRRKLQSLPHVMRVVHRCS